MFKGLYLPKVKSLETIVKPSNVYSIQSAEALLIPEKRQQYLKNIRSLLNLPPKLFDSLYYQVIKHFVEVCQNIQDSRYGMYSHSGGFVDHSLERASRALSLCLTHFFPEEKTFQNVSSQEALWIYAIFTAALYLDIGKMAIKYEISICNKDGSDPKPWLPYNGPMGKYGKYYQFDYLKENRDNLKRLVTGLIARQLLEQSEKDDETNTANGFNWLASNPEVLEAWLSILQGDRQRLPMTTFMSVIPLADAEIIKAFLDAKNQSQGFSQEPFQNPHEKQMTTQGEAFLLWLRDKLEKDQFSINEVDSYIHVVDEGALLDPKLFKDFSEEKHLSDPGKVVEDFHRHMELYWDSPTALHDRVIGIQGLAAKQFERFIYVGRLDLIFLPTFQHSLSPYVVKTAQNPIQATQLASPKLPERRTSFTL